MINDNIVSQEDIFDPKIHLAYAPPTQKFTLQDLRLSHSDTSTEIAATVPFPILSVEGVRAYRRSLFRPDLLRTCASSPYPGTLVLRNAAEHSKFINDFWTHPMTLSLVSDAAGVPLSILMRTEIGHTNIQTSGDNIEDMIAELRVVPDFNEASLTEEERDYDPLKSRTIIPWHYDSYPYVCVLMLSNTEGMIGGETYIKGGDGVPVKVEGPTIGHGVLLQGGEVQHLAARAFGVKERISTITSYRANLRGVYDSSYISNIRPYVDVKILYKQWALYRLEKMKTEIEAIERQIEQCREPLDVTSIHRFAEKQCHYLKRTVRQLLPYDEYEKVYCTYGKSEVYKALQMWARAEKLPNFAKYVSSVKPANWKPDSPLWYDLAESQIDVQAGKVLQAQTGRYRWNKDRPFSMGDELLRQGLPELFLLWLDATGLYDLVKSIT